MNCVARHLEAKGLSQKAFADLVQVSQPTVSQWVRGTKKPQGEHILRLARELGVEPIEVLAEFHLPEGANS